jgi:non-specific serine/threonine protein kinase
MFAGTDFAEADVADLILSLVDKSIVMREESAGRVRLRMPEIIRSYGLDGLRESHQETAARRRHRDWYVALSARACQEWIGPDQLGWFGLIRMQHANIRAVLDFSLTDPDGAGDAVDIVVSLLDYWMAFGFLSEGRHWLDPAVDLLPANGLRRARALRAACILAAMQGDHAAASATWEVSRVLAEQADDEREVGWVAWAGAVAALQRDDVAAASYAIEESCRLFGSVGDVHGLISAMGTRVVVAALSAEPGSALDRAGEFLAEAEPCGDRWTMSWALWGLGIAHWRLGDIDKAADVEARSLTLRAPFDQLGLGLTAEILSWTAYEQGHAEQAATLMGAARHCLSATKSSLAVFPYLLDDHQRCEVSLRSKLGDPAFELAIERGARLALTKSSPLPLASRPNGSPKGGASTTRPGHL